MQSSPVQERLQTWPGTISICLLCLDYPREDFIQTSDHLVDVGPIPRFSFKAYNARSDTVGTLHYHKWSDRSRNLASKTDSSQLDRPPLPTQSTAEMSDALSIWAFQACLKHPNVGQTIKSSTLWRRMVALDRPSLSIPWPMLTLAISQ